MIIIHNHAASCLHCLSVQPSQSFSHIDKLLLHFLSLPFFICQSRAIRRHVSKYWHVMVFIPYKYVYNVNITDIEKPTQSFYAYSHSMIFVIPFNLKKTNKFYLIKSHRVIKIVGIKSNQVVINKRFEETACSESKDK